MSSLGIFDKKTKTYKKVAGLAEAAAVDDALSSTSTNPVQNKVVTSNLTDLKMLGWAVPRECPIQNEVNGNQFVQKVGRLDAGSLSWEYVNEFTAFRFASSNDEYLKYGIKRHTFLYLYGFDYIGVLNRWADIEYANEKSIAGVWAGGGDDGFIIKSTDYTDSSSFKQAMQGQYLYYELDTPITKTIDGNEIGETVSDVRKETTVNLLKPTLQTSTLNGVTCTNNGDGTYTINGTSTTDRWISFADVTLNPGKYKFIATENNVEVSNLCVLLDHTSIATPGSKFTIQSKSVCSIGLSTKNNTFNNILIKPMLTTNLSATYDDFVPYTGDTGKLNGDVAALKAEVANNKTTVDAAMSDTSTNPVQNKVIKSALDGKSDINHSHNYAGSSSAGGSANSAVKLDTSTAGSATQPVYFSGGKPVACSHTLGKSVPSDAVFTDTKVTNTLNTHTKAYVTGTTSASTNTGTQIFDPGVYLGTGTGQLTLEGSSNINYGTGASIFNVKIPASHNNKLYGANIAPYRDDMTDYITGLNINCGTSTGPGMKGIEVTCRVNNHVPTVYIDRSGGTNSYALQVPNGKSYIATIYSDSSTITISDREKKTDIQSISDKYEELFFKLQPRLFKFKDGTSGRIHIGAIAQEVEEALKEVGLSDTEFAGFVRQEKEYVVNKETGEITQEEGYDYYLRYEEFVMLLCHMLQKLYAEKEEQDNKISDLESRIVALESKLG